MNNRSNQYSLLLLAGGKSSRMGKNKAELVYEGKTFANLLAEKAEKLGIKEIFVSGFAYKEESADKTGEYSAEKDISDENRRHVHIISKASNK